MVKVQYVCLLLCGKFKEMSFLSFRKELEKIERPPNAIDEYRRGE